MRTWKLGNCAWRWVNIFQREERGSSIMEPYGINGCESSTHGSPHPQRDGVRSRCLCEVMRMRWGQEEKPQCPLGKELKESSQGSFWYNQVLVTLETGGGDRWAARTQMGAVHLWEVLEQRHLGGRKLRKSRSRYRQDHWDVRQPRRRLAWHPSGLASLPLGSQDGLQPSECQDATWMAGSRGLP